MKLKQLCVFHVDYEIACCNYMLLIVMKQTVIPCYCLLLINLLLHILLCWFSYIVGWLVCSSTLDNVDLLL